MSRPRGRGRARGDGAERERPRGGAVGPPSRSRRSPAPSSRDSAAGRRPATGRGSAAGGAPARRRRGSRASRSRLPSTTLRCSPGSRRLQAYSWFMSRKGETWNSLVVRKGSTSTGELIPVEIHVHGMGVTADPVTGLEDRALVIPLQGPRRHEAGDPASYDGDPHRAFADRGARRAWTTHHSSPLLYPKSSEQARKKSRQRCSQRVASRLPYTRSRTGITEARARSRL